ncbi:hypothetical protein SUGI_0573560 [Cryptomeria japonica]|nr:hypothetical protein SUGI_0573520 [Cryptomeria japonica]GLJ29080.1 hypothetical protein SUGI_0573560 [Cryptomeria japonica]
MSAFSLQSMTRPVVCGGLISSKSCPKGLAVREFEYICCWRTVATEEIPNQCTFAGGRLYLPMKKWREQAVQEISCQMI